MKINLYKVGCVLTLAPLLSAGGASAGEATATPETPPAVLPAAMTAPIQATKAVFIPQLQEPQGLAFDKRGNILVADYKAGEILRYSRQGKLLGKVATNLKSPSQIVTRGDSIFVSERKGNRVIKIDARGRVSAVGQPIAEPMGLVSDPQNNLFVVSHTTSKIYRLDATQWTQIFAAPQQGGRRYGYRILAYDGALLLSDEIEGEVLMLTPGGRIATWATGIEDPSGVVIGPDGAVYVANEGGGGQLLRLDATGKATVVSGDLGRPRGILFLDARTLLVSNRDGSVWRLKLP